MDVLSPVCVILKNNTSINTLEQKYGLVMDVLSPVCVILKNNTSINGYVIKPRKCNAFMKIKRYLYFN